ncbi:hypothetical protein [Burkholderia cenocepacia]|uniref:hypothetical protein n=1 Tax=Burkholderia cenocepacia TaxID=95486 RepID=UPI002AB6B4ED|nr:hypothetical protein [Burkholderia cenocepacia]
MAEVLQSRLFGNGSRMARGARDEGIVLRQINVHVYTLEIQERKNTLLMMGGGAFSEWLNFNLGLNH